MASVAVPEPLSYVYRLRKPRVSDVPRMYTFDQSIEENRTRRPALETVCRFRFQLSITPIISSIFSTLYHTHARSPKFKTPRRRVSEGCRVVQVKGCRNILVCTCHPLNDTS